MSLSRLVEKKKKVVERCEEQLLKMEVQATDREENKQIALGTSKLNYLDPRISVAWYTLHTTHTTHTTHHQAPPPGPGAYSQRILVLKAQVIRS